MLSQSLQLCCFFLLATSVLSGQRRVSIPSVFRNGIAAGGHEGKPSRSMRSLLPPRVLNDNTSSREPMSKLEHIGTATRQVVTHFSCLMRSGGDQIIQIGTPSSRILCLSGAACYIATKHLINRSEGAQRACFFWQRAGPIVAHYKFTQWWLTASKAPLERRNTVYKSLHDRYSGPSLDIILSLKGLFAKVGQVMSSRSDFMPVQYVEAFSTVQDAIPQWPIEEAIGVIRDSLRSEYGLDFEDVFESIDGDAIGCASIGQVHRAILKDSWVDADPHYSGGKTVALKVMHPDSKKRFSNDFQVFKWLTRIALPGWRSMLEELEKRVMTEFDYHNEAKSLSLVRNNLLESPYYSRRVRIPQPYFSLCCKHLLVMEFLDGKKLTDAIKDKLSNLLGGDKETADQILATRQKEVLFGEEGNKSNKIKLLDLLDIHGIGGLWRGLKCLALYRKLNGYIDLLVDVHGYQIFENGAFNGDPHPGNILELSDGRLGLIDYGQMKTLDDDERLKFAQVVLDVGTHADSLKIAESMRLAGFKTRLDGSDALAEYAVLFFDSDHRSKSKGYSTPQHYFQALMDTDPLIQIPDSAIMVGRCSLLFRGAGSALGRQVQTSVNWSKHARQALLDSKAAS